MKKAINVILGLCAVVLLYLCYESIMQPIQFNKEKDIREAAVKARLIQIKDAEEQYRQQHQGEFCDTLDVLINGPTSNGFGKDIFRKMARDLYGRLKAYEDTGLEPEAIKTVKLALAAKHMVDLETLNNTPISRLVELAEADKDGRVIILPCKVGHRVFALLDTDKHISECEVKQIGLGNEIGFVGLEPIGARGREYGVALNGFGKTVFLTREEAEKALEEREGKKDD